MSYLTIDHDDHDHDDLETTEEASIRIANPESEGGYVQEPGPLTWLNSARITTSPDEDAVHCLVSVGDPRGGFCFTVRRLPDGRIVIHTPRPGEGMPHIDTREIYPGILELITTPGGETAMDFSDDDPDEDDE